MMILLTIVAVLFAAGASCSVVALERTTRADLVRNAPYSCHPLHVRTWSSLLQPSMFPHILLFMIWNGCLAVITVGVAILGYVSLIVTMNKELRHIAATYWGHASEPGGDAAQFASQHQCSGRNEDNESREDTVASEASAIASSALRRAGMRQSDRHDIRSVGIVELAERNEFCSFSLHLECSCLADRGQTDPAMVAKMAIGETISVLDLEQGRGNHRVAQAHEACRDAFAAINHNSLAA